MRTGCLTSMTKANRTSNVSLRVMGTAGVVVEAKAAVEVVDAVMEVDGDEDSAANKAVIFIKPWMTMTNDYQRNEPTHVEGNPNKQSVPCLYHVEYHVHYSPSKPFNTKTPECWLMLDSCSTLNLISNKSWLSDIHEVDTAMHIHSTRGVSVTCKMGYLGNYPAPVWYLASNHANILSLHDVTQHYRVTMDTTVENAIIFHGANGQQHRFNPSGKGLYKWEHMMDCTTDNPC